LAHLLDVLRGCSFLPASKTLKYCKSVLFGQELVLYLEDNVVSGLLNDLNLTGASQMLDYTALVEHLWRIEDVITNGSENLIKAKYFRP